MSRPAHLRDAILELLPRGDEIGTENTWFSAHRLAALIYTTGDETRVRPAHLAAVRRVLYELRSGGLASHFLYRFGRGTQARQYWYRVVGDDSGQPTPAEKVADTQHELRRRLALVLGMLGSASDGERDNAARKAAELQRESGWSWAQLLALDATR